MTSAGNQVQLTEQSTLESSSWW